MPKFVGGMFSSLCNWSKIKTVSSNHSVIWNIYVYSSLHVVQGNKSKTE